MKPRANSVKNKAKTKKENKTPKVTTTSINNNDANSPTPSDTSNKIKTDVLKSWQKANTELAQFNHSLLKEKLHKTKPSLAAKRTTHASLYKMLPAHQKIFLLTRENGLLKQKNIILQIEKYLENLVKLMNQPGIEMETIYLLNFYFTILANNLSISTDVDKQLKDHLRQIKLPEALIFKATIQHQQNLGHAITQEYILSLSNALSLTAEQQTKITGFKANIDAFERDIKMDSLSRYSFNVSPNAKNHCGLRIPHLLRIANAGRIAIHENNYAEALKATMGVLKKLDAKKPEDHAYLFKSASSYLVDFVSYIAITQPSEVAKIWLQKLKQKFEETRLHLSARIILAMETELKKIEAFIHTSMPKKDDKEILQTPPPSVQGSSAAEDAEIIDTIFSSFAANSQDQIPMDKLLKNGEYLKQGDIYALNIFEIKSETLIKTHQTVLKQQLSQIIDILELEKCELQKALASGIFDSKALQSKINHIVKILNTYFKHSRKYLSNEEITPVLKVIQYWQYTFPNDIQTFNLNKILSLPDYVKHFSFSVNAKLNYFLKFHDTQSKEVFIKTLLADTSKNKLIFSTEDGGIKLENMMHAPVPHIQDVLKSFLLNLSTEENKPVDIAYTAFKHVPANDQQSINAKRKQRAARRRVEKNKEKVEDEPQQLTPAIKSATPSSAFYATTEQAESTDHVEAIPSQSCVTTIPIIEDARFLPLTEDTRRDGFALAKADHLLAAEKPRSPTSTRIEKVAPRETLGSVIDALAEIQKEHQTELGILCSLLRLTKLTCDYLNIINLAEEYTEDYKKLRALRLSLVHPDFANKNWLHSTALLTKFIENFIDTRNISTSIEAGLIAAIDQTPLVKQLLKLDTQTSPEKTKKATASSNGIFGAIKKTTQITLTEHVDRAYINNSLNSCIEKIREFGHVFIALQGILEKPNNDDLNKQSHHEQTKHMYAIQYLLICVNECINSLGFAKNTTHESTLEHLRNIIAHEAVDLSSQTIKQFLENDLPMLEKDFLSKKTSITLNI